MKVKDASMFKQIMEASGVKEDILACNMYGKRPNCAKLDLRFTSTESISERRARQLAVIQKTRSQNWVPRLVSEPAWIKVDKTPCQRVISKSVAELSSFVEKEFRLRREAVEVDPLPAARAYLGDYKGVWSLP